MSRRETLAVAAAFVLIAAAYVASVPGVLFIKPDTAVYMGLGRSLARGAGYTFNFAPYGKYPPVFPAMLALVYRAAGESIWAMQAMTALCGVGALAAAWALVRARAGWRPAAGVAVLTAACTWFQAHSSIYLLSGAPLALFSMAALWLGEREIRAARFSVLGWLAVAGCATLAVGTHMAGVALIPALAGGALFARGQSRPLRQRALAAGLAGGIASVAAVCWVARGWGFGGETGYAYHLETILPQEAAGLADGLGLRAIEWVAALLSLSYRQVRLGWAAGLLGLLVVPGLVRGFRRFRSCSEIYVCAYFAVVLLLGGRTGHERYAVPTVPLMFYYGYLSLRAFGQWAAEMAGRRMGAGARARAEHLAGIAIAAVALALATNGAINRTKGRRGASAFSRDDREEAARQAAAWEEAGRWAESQIPLDASVYVGSGASWSIACFFLERRIIPCLGISGSGPQVLRHLAGSGAGFLLIDTRDWSVKRLAPLLARHPDCFVLLGENAECALYRVDRARLAEAARAAPAAP